MTKISIKKLKYSDLDVLKNYFETGITSEIDLLTPEKSTVMAIIGELYMKICKKLLFGDRYALHFLTITKSEALAIIAYTQYIKISNLHSFATVDDIKQRIIKQLN